MRFVPSPDPSYCQHLFSVRTYVGLIHPLSGACAGGTYAYKLPTPAGRYRLQGHPDGDTWPCTYSLSAFGVVGRIFMVYSDEAVRTFSLVAKCVHTRVHAVAKKQERLSRSGGGTSPRCMCISSRRE